MSGHNSLGSILNIAIQVAQMEPGQQIDAGMVGMDRHGRIVTARSIYARLNRKGFFRKLRCKLKLRKAQRRLIRTLSSERLRARSTDTINPARVLTRAAQMIAVKTDLKVLNIEPILKKRDFIDCLRDCETDSEKKKLLHIFNPETAQVRSRLPSTDSGIGSESEDNDDISPQQIPADVLSIFYQVVRLTSGMAQDKILKGLQNKECVELLRQDLKYNQGIQVKSIISAFICDTRRPFNERQSSMATLLRRYNMTLIQSEGDGNCMFHSLSEKGIKPDAEVNSLRVKLHHEMERYINFADPDISENITESLSAINNKAEQLIALGHSDIDPIDLDIGNENLYSIIEERVRVKEVLQRGQYMEPADMVFLARVEKKPIVVLDIKGNVLGAVDEMGRLLKTVKTIADIKHLADTPHHCLAFDSVGSHFLRIQVNAF